MLYLLWHAKAEGDSFWDPLSTEGVQQSLHLAGVLERLGVETIYTAPYRRALDTIKSFVQRKRSLGKFCRVEVNYNLSNGVFLPEMRPEAVTLEQLISYGLKRNSVAGNIPGPEVTEMYERRIVDFFCNEFWPKYEDAPNPTVIVADGMTVAVILYYIMRHKPYARAKEIVQSLKPGAVLAFKGDGFQLQFESQVA